MNKLTRDERQDLTIDNWKKAGGRATILAATGFGKTRIALKTIKRILDKKPDSKIIVVVPTDYLKTQWLMEIVEWGLSQNVHVYIINSLIKERLSCDLLVCDEVHLYMAETFSQVFLKVKYKHILCLTGTIERLDGKQVLLQEYAPICDTVTLDDATKNGWVAEFKQFKVFLDVDLDEYKKHHAQFLHHFSYFNFSFETAMACVTNVGSRINYATQLKDEVKNVMLHAMGFIRALKARKSFIYDHPKKIEIVNKIIHARENAKIITFTKSVAHAKQICCGDIYHGSLSKKKKDKVMADFNDAESGVMNSCKALDVGADVKGVNTIIIISGDSSSITKRQRIGRGIRKEEDKIAEIWQLVIKGTVEEEWYRKSSTGLKGTTINEEQLDELLTTGKFEDKRHKETSFLFRF